MNTISLHGAEFFAYHGFYPEEQKLGNKFIVDIDVEFVTKDFKEDDIGATVDYEQLYEIVEEQMKQTRKLIEAVAQAVADVVKERFPIVKKVTISIKKLNPPLKGKVDYSCITLSES
jgi:dihydroneopterin aldolase